MRAPNCATGPGNDQIHHLLILYHDGKKSVNERGRPPRDERRKLTVRAKRTIGESEDDSRLEFRVLIAGEFVHGEKTIVVVRQPCSQ
jgi:hypothetical protein